MELSGRAGQDPGKNTVSSGADLDPEAEPGYLFIFIYSFELYIFVNIFCHFLET